MKHLILQYIHEHKDIIQATIVGGGGLGGMFVNIELGLKILIAITTLGFIVWKWACAYSDRKNKKNG